MILQTVEYALRAIVTLAQHEGQPCTAKKLAEITPEANQGSLHKRRDNVWFWTRRADA